MAWQSEPRVTAPAASPPPSSAHFLCGPGRPSPALAPASVSSLVGDRGPSHPEMKGCRRLAGAGAQAGEKPRLPVWAAAALEVL